MNLFNNLIRGLKAFTAVIIENAFVYEDDAEKILGKFCLLPVRDQEKILRQLKEKGFDSLVANLNSFNELFQKTNRDRNLEEDMPATEYFKRYLGKIGANELDYDRTVTNIAQIYKDNGDDRINDILLKFGIFKSIDEASYTELIDTFKKTPGLSLLFYRAQPSVSQTEEFYQDIEISMEETESQFCLAIIDKKLGTGDSGEEGKSFIKENIINRNQIKDKKIVCCLYTTTPENGPLESFDHYFIQEIAKDADNKFEQLAKSLTNAAYAAIFDKLRYQYTLSAQNALNMVLLNQKNIKYIIEHSYLEGIPGIEAIKYWFNLAQQYQFEIEEINALNFFSGIVSFFDNEHLDDHPHIGKIGESLKQLNSFELFDYKVNSKYLPIAPGDIWQIGDEYYILMGQLCDLLLRSNNKRNAKFGELLKVEIVDLPQRSEKFSIDITGNRKLITIQNFPKGPGDFCSITVDVATGTTEFADLEALDLAMFNSDGNAIIDLNDGVTVEALRTLPSNFADYYVDIREKYRSLKETTSKVDRSIFEFANNNIKFSKIRFTEKSGVIDLGFRRAGRLKGRFYDSTYNNFLNNKGRIDLNLIDNSPEHVSTVKLECSFVHTDSPTHTFEQANLWFNSSGFYFKRQDLMPTLPGGFKPILNYCSTELKMGDQRQYILTKVDEGIFSLQLKYMINDDTFQGKPHYSYKSLFGEPKPEINPKFKVEGEDESSFIGDNGHASVSLSIEQLNKGVIVYEKKLKLQFVNGILSRTNIEE
ncbi:hypothetical protein ACFQRK_19385 [Parapedobacter sp. GCM10030251]|uniref:hypothetical protein n=1 Tax=Parapedobacter sp. GCM10030251 TaxID=3273419 RepID=UPI0036068BA7